jgi:hypothetical protein
LNTEPIQVDYTGCGNIADLIEKAQLAPNRPGLKILELLKQSGFETVTSLHSSSDMLMMSFQSSRRLINLKTEEEEGMK